MALLRCSSIHTFGMRYPIDVALVERTGKVLVSLRQVAPGRIVCASGAWVALERPSDADPWPQEGSWVSLANICGVTQSRTEECCV
ncbi:MAG: hypothetical protein Q4A01_04705 [Coriobacteriales bacterium]|nr:hypothetical protein [Coriobacteriales bacterium]